MNKCVQSFIACLLAGAGLVGFACAADAPVKVLTPDQEARKALAEEGIVKMKEWKDPITQQSVEKLVNDAVALFEKEGPACYPKFKGKNSEFLPGIYVFIVDKDCKMLMHPILWQMEGNSMLNLKDLKTSTPIIVPLVELATKNPQGGWHAYAWKNPKRDGAIDDKWSFAKKAVYKDAAGAATEVIVCAGEFGLQIKK